MTSMGLVPSASLGGVALVILGMVLSPGPNMVHLASRSISQASCGPRRFAGGARGFVVYLLTAVAGLSTLFAAEEAGQAGALTGVHDRVMTDWAERTKTRIPSASQQANAAVMHEDGW
jgi:hypothetical protein